jgi:hypothetical protein
MPDLYDLSDEQLAEVVRFNGANAVIDALLTVAVEAYAADAVPKVHELVLRRAARSEVSA